jgi:F-box-like
MLNIQRRHIPLLVCWLIVCVCVVLYSSESVFVTASLSLSRHATNVREDDTDTKMSYNTNTNDMTTHSTQHTANDWKLGVEPPRMIELQTQAKHKSKSTSKSESESVSVSVSAASGDEDTYGVVESKRHGTTDTSSDTPVPVSARRHEQWNDENGEKADDGPESYADEVPTTKSSTTTTHQTYDDNDGQGIDVMAPTYDDLTGDSRYNDGKTNSITRVRETLESSGADEGLITISLDMVATLAKWIGQDSFFAIIFAMLGRLVIITQLKAFCWWIYRKLRKRYDTWSAHREAQSAKRNNIRKSALFSVAPATLLNGSELVPRSHMWRDPVSASIGVKVFRQHVLAMLDGADVARSAHVCRSWHTIINSDPRLRQRIHVTHARIGYRSNMAFPSPATMMPAANSPAAYGMEQISLSSSPVPGGKKATTVYRFQNASQSCISSFDSRSMSTPPDAFQNTGTAAYVAPRLSPNSADTKWNSVEFGAGTITHDSTGTDGADMWADPDDSPRSSDAGLQPGATTMDQASGRLAQMPTGGSYPIASPASGMQPSPHRETSPGTLLPAAIPTLNTPPTSGTRRRANSGSGRGILASMHSYHNNQGESRIHPLSLVRSQSASHSGASHTILDMTATASASAVSSVDRSKSPIPAGRSSSTSTTSASASGSDGGGGGGGGGGTNVGAADSGTATGHASSAAAASQLAHIPGDLDLIESAMHDRADEWHVTYTLFVRCMTFAILIGWVVIRFYGPLLLVGAQVIAHLLRGIPLVYGVLSLIRMIAPGPNNPEDVRIGAAQMLACCGAVLFIVENMYYSWHVRTPWLWTLADIGLELFRAVPLFVAIWDIMWCWHRKYIYILYRRPRSRMHVAIGIFAWSIVVATVELSYRLIGARTLLLWRILSVLGPACLSAIRVAPWLSLPTMLVVLFVGRLHIAPHSAMDRLYRYMFTVRGKKGRKRTLSSYDQPSQVASSLIGTGPASGRGIRAGVTANRSHDSDDDLDRLIMRRPVAVFSTKRLGFVLLGWFVWAMGSEAIFDLLNLPSPYTDYIPPIALLMKLTVKYGMRLFTPVAILFRLYQYFSSSISSNAPPLSPSKLKRVPYGKPPVRVASATNLSNLDNMSADVESGGMLSSRSSARLRSIPDDDYYDDDKDKASLRARVRRYSSMICSPFRYPICSCGKFQIVFNREVLFWALVLLVTEIFYRKLHLSTPIVKPLSALPLILKAASLAMLQWLGKNVIVPSVPVLAVFYFYDLYVYQFILVRLLRRPRPLAHPGGATELALVVTAATEDSSIDTKVDHGSGSAAAIGSSISSSSSGHSIAGKASTTSAASGVSGSSSGGIGSATSNSGSVGSNSSGGGGSGSGGGGEISEYAPYTTTERLYMFVQTYVFPLYTLIVFIWSIAVLRYGADPPRTIYWTWFVTWCGM